MSFGLCELGWEPTPVHKLRDLFCDRFVHEELVISPSGTVTCELIGLTFRADEPLIFGEVNESYVARELEWYRSQSRNVNDIPGGAPEIWKKVATPSGEINSNYGWCIWSSENFDQYENVLKDLKRDPSSRRAIMIYTRPDQHYTYTRGGMMDFCCTDAVQYFVRNGFLHCHVRMRSNDGYFGYRNDKAWQDYVLESLAKDLDLKVGIMLWTAGSLHFYQKDFYLLDHYDRTGEISIKYSDYTKLWPDSPYLRTP